MERICRGNDIFKSIYLITCTEILQSVAGNDSPTGNTVVSFFVDKISKKDSASILKKFRRSLGDLTFEDTMSSIEEFASVLNELRNSAAHEGDFWGVCFNNGYSNYPLMFSVDIDLKAFSRHNKTSHTFETTLDYGEFEDIFVRICLTFIRNYIASQDKDSW
mgnify:CR=1 FL=1